MTPPFIYESVDTLTNGVAGVANNGVMPQLAEKKMLALGIALAG